MLSTVALLVLARPNVCGIRRVRLRHTRQGTIRHLVACLRL